jgi:hypothetical protein
LDKLTGVVAKGQSDLKIGIETTIDATKPRAAIDLISLRPTGELLQVAANMPLVFDLNYTNSGTDTATKFACLFHVYIENRTTQSTKKRSWRISISDGTHMSKSP